MVWELAKGEIIKETSAHQTLFVILSSANRIQFEYSINLVCVGVFVGNKV